MKNPICPHCNTEHDIDSNESYFLYETDDYHQLTCNSCEKEFWVRTNATYSFTSAIDSDDL